MKDERNSDDSLALVSASRIIMSGCKVLPKTLSRNTHTTSRTDAKA